jgi:hypothetical protein
MDEQTEKNIEQRLTRLEKAVFGPTKGQTRETSAKGFAGLKGGLHLLISRGFFKTKKALAATRHELEKHDYHYSAAAIQTTLNRLSTRTGPLAAFKEGGKKVYVRRK